MCKTKMVRGIRKTDGILCKLRGGRTGAQLRKSTKAQMTVELRLTKWVRFGHAQSGPRKRREKTFQPEGITSQGLRHGGVGRNTESLAC